MKMIMLGTTMTAKEAMSATLVAEVFEPGTVLEHVLHIGSKLASMSPTALSLAKEAICRCTFIRHFGDDLSARR